MSRPRTPRPAWSRRTLRAGAGRSAAAWLTVIAGLTTTAPTAVAAQEEVRTSPFALPLARDALTLAESAASHLEAERWNEGLADLQRLLEEHGGEVLPDAWRESADRLSIHAAHPGAAAWATERLMLLPREAADLYRRRNEPTALRALERARTQARRDLLVDVARRWPITRAAASALWSLGDLELESGASADALFAYRRAERLGGLLGEELSSGAKARLETAGELGATRDIDPEGYGRRALPNGPVPKSDADSWSEPVLFGDHPLQQGGNLDYYSLFPVVARDRVLVNTSFEVYAVDAFTGEHLWIGGPPRGWSRLSLRSRNDLAKAISFEELLLAPAVGGNVVVAALQIPYSDNKSDRWQGIDIMEAIPERRLFAFDLDTGEELWSHVPPLAWDATEARYDWNPGAGSYSQRMLVAAPPTVVGGRVLVPCYRMSGRIEYHVACYDLATGERQWSTPLISGQRETNMFGRAGKEFVGSPVTVAGERVVVQTELGAVAALDLFTGHILWESLYEQLELPKTVSYNTPERHAYWRLTPPVVEGGLVISTPSDSKFLVAFRLEDGRVEWQQRQDKLRELVREDRRLKVDTLLGAVGDTVYLGGEKVLALQKPGGLERPGGFHPRWSYALDTERSPLTRPRALLTAEEVIVPVRDRRVVLDRNTGQVVRSLSGSWSFQDYGNVLVESGALFTLNRQQLNGFFDWETLLARQRTRLAEQPDDPDLRSATAELLTRRAIASQEAGDASGSLALLNEARALLEPLLADESGARDARRLVYGILRGEARALYDQANNAGALRALEEARGLAPHRAATCETLLAQEGILREASLEERLAVLLELERSCLDLPLPAERRADVRWLVGEALIDPSEFEALVDADLPIGLWVLLARADALARARRTGDALRNLHDAMARYGGVLVSPNWSVFDLVERRIARRLELDGRLEYAPFEERARTLFEAATANADPLLLERVGHLYPHSQAAAEARLARLELAFLSDDLTAVAETAYAAFSHEPKPGAADAHVLLRLARSFGRNGNLAFEAAALAELAEHHGALVSDLPQDGGRTLAELAAAENGTEGSGEPPQPDFPPRVHSAGSIPGRHQFLGHLMPEPFEAESAPEIQHVYLRGGSLRAFSSRAPAQLAWPAFDLPFPAEAERCATDATRIIAGGRKSLMAIDAAGEEAWSRRVEEGVVAVSADVGITLVLAGPSTNPDRLYAFDSRNGIPLWQLALPRRPGNWRWHTPIRRGGLAVLFASQWNHPSRALALDLFRGRLRAELELEQSVHNSIHESAWIDGDGRLCVPSFSQMLTSQSGVTGYDLDRGLAQWSVSFPPGEELYALAGHEGRDYLVTLGASLDGQRRSGAIYRLRTEIGELRTVVELKPGDEPMGLERLARTELETPLLFLHSRGGSSLSTPIRAIHLPYETRWVYSLPIANEELYDKVMPLPAVSAECVAMAFVTRRNRMPDRVRLVFVDKNTGLAMDKRDLDFGTVDHLELRGLGSSLFLVGRGRDPKASRIEILEDVR